MTTPTPDPKIPPLFSATEAAEELGVSRQAIVKSAAAGRIPGQLVGKTWVFRQAAIKAIKDQRGNDRTV
ncbi:helix-turn-helix domain-containing protein [Glycomyces sp. NPDC021274]|uniref:helix-turn-helix domain-containing protein n=1 Tax=Glycomyces sp. NPDC021274 TaxID=3155120 RepID=UPI0033ED8520